MGTITDSQGGQKTIPSMLRLIHERAQEAQYSAQVRAATAQVQRRKWILERSSFGVDYSGKIKIVC
jgi:hypothetical protein